MNFEEKLKSYMSANDEGQMLLALGSVRHDEIKLINISDI